MANIITSIRIVLSVGLLFCPTFSPVFYELYIAAGFSDMIKLLPALDVPVWLYIWTAVIAMIKLFNIATGYIRQKRFIAVHSVMNKVTGGLLFIFPLTLTFIDSKYSAAVVCAIATIAAFYEGYLIQGGNNGF